MLKSICTMFAALSFTKEERLIYTSGALVLVLLFGGIVIARVDRWRRRQMSEQDYSPENSTSFRQMFERGEISKEEYEKVLQRVAERAGSKAKPAATTEATSSTPSAENLEPKPPAESG